MRLVAGLRTRSACARPARRRRQAGGNPHRLGDLQPGLHGAQGTGLLEKEFAKDGIGIRWVQTLGSNKALEFLNAGSIDFGSTAGSAALLGKINGNPIKSIYVYSKPEWTALVTRKDTPINKIADLKGKRVAVTRGTDPHIFLVRALLSVGMTEKDIAECCCSIPTARPRSSAATSTPGPASIR